MTLNLCPDLTRTKIWTLACLTYAGIVVYSRVLFHIGGQAGQRTAIKNFHSLLKPGGILIIDHRNYDAILETGQTPPGPNVYYQVSICISAGLQRNYDFALEKGSYGNRGRAQVQDSADAFVP